MPAQPSSLRAEVQRLFDMADITLDGPRPQDIQIHDEAALGHWLRDQTLGFGESYMAGLWSAPALDQTICALTAKRHAILAEVKTSPKILWLGLQSRFLNRQSKARAGIVGRQHYDIDTKLYEAMLDPHMQYSCGYWEAGAETLEAAQEAKLDLIGRKLMLAPGMRVLDIGCGWGGLARYLADRFGVQVTGLTISGSQARYARNHFGHDDVDIRLQDYRDMDGARFDRIVSVGMLEHVGHKNYATYFNTVHKLLADGGLALIHSIGETRSARNADPWVDKYIFPNGLLPSFKQIARALPEPLVIEDWHNFGASYDKTLMAWHQRFEAAWPQLSADLGLDDRFRRMWAFYLLASAGNFRSRKSAQLWQIVLSKYGVPGGYPAFR